MSFLSKLLKKAKKPLLGIVRGAASAATGGLSEKAIGLGSAVIKARKVGKAVKALAKSPKLKLAEVKYSIPAPTEGVGVQATTMPGGASLRAKAPKRRKTRAKATKRRTTSATKSKSKRQPPKGGLNLKALSASWKAAGKPGTWQQWIKANK